MAAVSHELNVPVMVTDDCLVVFNGIQTIRFKIVGEELLFDFGSVVVPGHPEIQAALHSIIIGASKEEVADKLSGLIREQKAYKGHRMVHTIDRANTTMLLDIRDTLKKPQVVLACHIPKALARIEITVDAILSFINPKISPDWSSKVRRNANRSLGLQLPEDFAEPAPADKVPLAEALIHFVAPWQSIHNFNPNNDTATEKKCDRVFISFVPPVIDLKYSESQTARFYCPIYVSPNEIYKKISEKLNVDPTTIIIVDEFMNPIPSASPDFVFVQGTCHVFSTLPVEGGLLDTLTWAKHNIIDIDREVSKFEPAKFVLRALEFRTTVKSGMGKGRRTTELFKNGFPVMITPRTNADLANLGFIGFTLAVIARMMGRVPKKESVQLPTAGAGGGGGSSGASAGAGGGGSAGPLVSRFEFDVEIGTEGVGEEEEEEE